MITPKAENFTGLYADHRKLPSRVEYGLQIVDHSCISCGNKWVDSYLLRKTGSGYSYAANNREFNDLVAKDPSLITVCQHASPQQHGACFRCVTLGLSSVWKTPDHEIKYYAGPNQTPAESKTSAPKPKPISVDDLF